MRLNIGCGPNMFGSGWINYDREDMTSYLQALKGLNLTGLPYGQKRLASFIQTGSAVDFRVHDLRQGFAMHPNGTVDAIYLGQMIEHINPIYEAPKFIAECYRMLKPGGVLRLTTPDMNLLIKAYLEDHLDRFVREQPEFYRDALPDEQLAYLMYGACGPDCTWNHYEGHMFLYTKRSISKLLNKNGFAQEVKFWEDTGRSSDTVMAKDVVDEGLSHSFIAEVTK